MAKARSRECATARVSRALCDEVDVCALGFSKLQDGLVPPLLVAVDKQHVDVVAMLISAGADVNAVCT